MLRLALVLVALPLFFVPTAQAVVDPEAIYATCYRNAASVSRLLHNGNTTLTNVNRTDVPTDEGQDALWAATLAGRTAFAIVGGYVVAAREACRL